METKCAKTGPADMTRSPAVTASGASRLLGSQVTLGEMGREAF